MAKTTLRKLMEEQEREGVTVECGQFDSMESFFSYFDQHYKPMLEQVSNGYTPVLDDARLLRFFADDMLSLLQ